MPKFLLAVFYLSSPSLVFATYTRVGFDQDGFVGYHTLWREGPETRSDVSISSDRFRLEAVSLELCPDWQQPANPDFFLIRVYVLAWLEEPPNPDNFFNLLFSEHGGTKICQTSGIGQNEVYASISFSQNVVLDFGQSYYSGRSEDDHGRVIAEWFFYTRGRFISPEPSAALLLVVGLVTRRRQ